jgi:hypothetical protein
LYDLSRDIGETTDLAAREPAKTAQLAALWETWSAEQARPMF